MATHSCILAWRIPWTEEPARLQSMGHKELDMTECLSHASAKNALSSKLQGRQNCKLSWRGFIPLGKVIQLISGGPSWTPASAPLSSLSWGLKKHRTWGTISQGLTQAQTQVSQSLTWPFHHQHSASSSAQMDRFSYFPWVLRIQGHPGR